MNAHDDSLLDSVAVLALGALPAAEAREVASHVRTCAVCAREYAELRGVADLVAYQAELPGDAADLGAARLRARILDAVRPADFVPVPASANSHGARRRRLGGPATWLAYGAAAAAIVIALVSTSTTGALRTQNERERQRITALESQAGARTSQAATAEARARSLDAAVATLLAPDAKHYRVRGGEVIESRGRVVIALHDVPAPPSGKVYQAWTRTKGTTTMAPSVTFTPNAHGVALVELPRTADSLDIVAVSVEPVGGSKAPTSKPAFVRPLS